MLRFGIDKLRFWKRDKKLVYFKRSPRRSAVLDLAFSLPLLALLAVRSLSPYGGSVVGTMFFYLFFGFIFVRAVYDLLRGGGVVEGNVVLGGFLHGLYLRLGRRFLPVCLAVCVVLYCGFVLAVEWPGGGLGAMSLAFFRRLSARFGFGLFVFVYWIVRNYADLRDYYRSPADSRKAIDWV